ncbi:MAG: cyclic nucleotide-binding domain-containing protein [Chitinivibrionales bacterium]|nr:cyclic nucleotide-binding domain-containing protein [Chitinivibrionales bacterium]MBD3394137.1 cyclic nucleotide-binding domain-containing protein [Chitinivibrionales bacterium]
MERSQLKTGHRPVQLNVRTLKPGDVLFEEGSRGRELFVVQEGKVGVYKITPEGETELAEIEKNAIVGEMSLLDNLPRSATVRAKVESKVLVVNEAVFHANLSKAPVWLTSIVKIVVSRLRDANRRVDQTALRDRERGLASLLLLLLPQYKYEISSQIALSYDLLVVEAYYVCRLKKKESAKTLSGIEKRGVVEISEDTEHKKHVVVKDMEVLKLFHEYLGLKSEQKKFREAGIPDDVVAVLSNIAYVAQKSGRESEEGVMLSKSALLEDLSDKNPDQLEKSLLDLRRRGLAEVMPQEHDTMIIFQPETLSRIKKIKEWLPKFEMSVA